VECVEIETEDGQTILTGEVKDQPHLFGVLGRLNGLGLELLSMQAQSETPARVPKGFEVQARNRHLSHLPGRAYSPECVERKFSEVHFHDPV
jgi:hypothetical protein